MTQQTTNSNSTPITVADALLHYLSLEKVDHVFGIPGGGLANLLTAFKAKSDQFKYIICRHETGAAYIADGYCRATGKMGVVMVTSGPGATNALTGVMNAQNDGSAMMLLTGEVDESYFGLGYLQEGTDAKLNIEAIYAAATGYSAMISDSSDFEAIFKQALRDALSIPRRSVHISMPNNVSFETISKAVLPDSTNSYRVIPSGAPIEDAERVMSVLHGSKRPLIFLGNGCREALKDNLNCFINFVEEYGIPVITTADAKGIFPESHPLSLRVYGIANCMWPYYWMTAESSEDAYDALLIIGSSLGELSTNKWLPLLQPANGPLIQVDIDQSIIGRSFPVSHGIVAEAGAFIRDLEKLIPKFPADKKLVETRKSIVETIKKQYPAFINPEQYNSNSNPIEPAALMRSLQESLPANKETKLFIDAGNCVGWAVHYLEIAPPWAIHSALSMGPMGFAVAAVIGAKFGRPDATCIAIVGDGAFMMHGAEISTARQYNIGAIWIVLYDNNLSMVSQGMDQFFPDKEHPGEWEKLYELGSPDLKKFAEGLGADAYSIDEPEELNKIMPSVLKLANEQNRPQVIIANINRKSIPPYYNPLYAPSKPK
ncbi:thiamine pyrophosphate-binding protein [Daejeonella oryzae]|uniref:thiamine pyrophosphate-binding protein n=1 Tax=Daejeonella oryzae TaxID=1122943 RepID=UPI00041FA9B4|nr:thiamine pyrophosphate-binding protein [Daejeonella oryzae]